MAIGWIVMLLLFNVGCSFDNEEEYYAHLMCDTVNVTYSGMVAPIFSQSCTSCHSVVGGNYPDLENYENIRDYIDEKPGHIPASIRHITGFSPMPLTTQKLPECDIKKIELWIMDGYPNN